MPDSWIASAFFRMSNWKRSIRRVSICLWMGPWSHPRMKKHSTMCGSKSGIYDLHQYSVSAKPWSKQCNIRSEPGFLFRSPGFSAFREELYEAQSRRILAAAFPRAAAAAAPGSAADHSVQLVPARGAVSVYAVGTHLLAQQRRVHVYGYAGNRKTR